MSARLTILSVAYALAPVGTDAVGGAEQILAAIDEALVAAGHRSLVVACQGSMVAGELIDTGVNPCSIIDIETRHAAERAVRQAIEAALVRERVDLVHAHGFDFAATLPPSGPRRLVTLHLPPSWYPSLQTRPGDWLNCVSASQEQACPTGLRLSPYIPNGVPVERLAAHRLTKRRFALHLGRVCPEKGQHIALAAARSAGMPLLLGGQVYPYPAHQIYFADEIRPQLDNTRRFLGPLAFARKRRLLSAAACLLVPSLAAETSSLVAMEAAACGTPVIAFRAGALPEIVDDGATGFLVDTTDEMASAIARVGIIDPEHCRSVAQRRFSADAMAAAYFARYNALVAEAAAA